MKILVLEADKKDQIITETLLKNKQHTVIIILKPYDTLLMLKNESFDMVFMPLEINGVDSLKLSREIKKYHPGQKIYAYSRHLHIYDTDILEMVEHDGFFNRRAAKKPINPDITIAADRFPQLSVVGSRVFGT